jgi:hypothetical protein
MNKDNKFEYVTPEELEQWVEKAFSQGEIYR